MSIHPIYKHRWSELFVCAIVVALVSMLINVQSPSGVIIIGSLASTSLAVMVAPGSPTNSIRSVLLSYIIAMFVSVTVGFVFSFYIDSIFSSLVDNQMILFFVKFLIMLMFTLFLFGYFNAYHPPSIGAMLTYTIDTGFDDIGLIIVVPMSVIFILACIKSYIYYRHPEQYKWSEFAQEFSKSYRKIHRQEFKVISNKKALLIAKAMKDEGLDADMIIKTTKLTAADVEHL